MRTSTLITVILLFVLSYKVTAQTNIEGTIKDTEGNELPYSNVLLLHPQDSSLIKGNVADENGNFTITDVTPGAYMVSAMTVGYKPVYNAVDISNAPVKLSLLLQEATQELDEVTVTATKPLYEKKADRTIVNVKSSITSTGRTALEVLERSPGVSVNRQSNTLSMYGKPGVRVMINGKMSQMPLDAVVQMLKGMNAANIEKIELITSPPAKYDAEGNAGIINIVMTENTDMGTNGNFGLTAGYNQAETLGANFNINHRGKNFNYFLDYSIMYDNNNTHWINQWSINNNGTRFVAISDQQRSARTTVQNIRTGLEYQLTERTNVSLLLTGYQRLWDMYDAFTDNTRTFSEDSVISTEMDILEINKWSSFSGNVGLTHQFGNDQNLSINYDYLYYIHDNPSSYDFTTLINNQSAEDYHLFDVDKNTPINFHVFSLDYANQFTKQFSISAGIKGSLSNFENDVNVSTQVNDQSEINQQYSSFSTLDENILAGYLSWDWKISQWLKANGGLRYEYTDSYLSTAEQPVLVDREFGNFFPSLNISLKQNENNSFSLAYSKRITRPTYNDMAPFVFFIGPSTSVGGNPGLRPAISNNIDFTYNYKQWWISIKYSDIDNSINRFQPEVNFNTYEMISRSQNADYERIWAASTGLPFTITPWWEIQNDITLYHRAFRTLYLDQNISDNNIYFNFNATTTFTLPDAFFVEVSGNYQSGSYWGINKIGPMSQVNIGIKKEFKENKGTLTLSFSDIFHDMVWDWNTDFPGNRVNSTDNYDFNLRSISLTYTRSFGNKKLKSLKIKSGAEDERKRVN